MVKGKIKAGSSEAKARARKAAETRAASRVWGEKQKAEGKRRAGRLPKYEPHAFRTAEQAAKEYDDLAHWREREVADLEKAIVERRREGKPSVSSWSVQLRAARSMARRARAAAARLREGK